MKVTDYIVEFLKQNGVDTVFGYTGGSIADLIDSVYKAENIKFIQNRHEQASGFCANAYAQITGNIGVAISSSGPGACNLINGIANAYFDSIPCLFITGNVNSLAAKNNDKIRQNGFQETDIVSMVKGITKYAVKIKKAEDIVYELEKAFYIAKEDRQGAVLIDIPYDIQREQIESDTPSPTCLANSLRSSLGLRHPEFISGSVLFEFLKNILSCKMLKQVQHDDYFFVIPNWFRDLFYCNFILKLLFYKMLNQVQHDDFKLNKSGMGNNNKINDVLTALKNSHKPVILLGGGAKYTGNEIKELLKKVKIPVVSSLCGIDILDNTNDCYFGFIGTYGNEYSNKILKNSDLIIVLGSRLDERQIGYKRNGFAPNAKIIRVEIDPVEINRTVDENITINTDVKGFLQNLTKENLTCFNYQNWFDTITKYKNSINPKNNFYTELSKYIKGNAVICSDVGLHQMHIAQNFKIKENQRLLNSAGFGSMGYSLPAAIGAYFASPDRQIISINGDGGIQMNLQEFQTICSYNIPVHTIIINNGCLGMIRKLQENLFENRTYASVKGFDAPDFEKIAYAYNMNYLKIADLNDIKNIEKVLNSNKSSIIELYIQYENF